MGFLFLFLSAAFSLSVAQILKIVETKSTRVLQILVINYLVAVIISVFSADWSNISHQVKYIPIWIHAAFLGVLFIVNFMIYSKSIDKNGMGVSIAAMRMSLVFPILLSLFIYYEKISIGLVLGIILSFVALILLVPASGPDKKIQFKFAVLPALLFFISGITDSGLKVFEQEFSMLIDESQFLTALFFFAFLTGALVLISRNQFRFTFKEVSYGVVLGVVNLYSSYFILLSLKHIPGSVVFPVANLAIVFAGTLLGVLYWKDKPLKRQWIGLLVASISIVLLVL